MIGYNGIALLIGFLLDLCLGDPEWLPHPVRTMGSLIAFLEKRIRRGFGKTPKGELVGGVFLTVLVLLTVFFASAGLLFLAYLVFPYGYVVVSSLIFYQMLALKDLRKESMVVHDRLQKGDLEGARCGVSRIVGRDTDLLSEEGIIKAAVETVAENTSDGVTAPLLFMALFGPVGTCLYKAVNTMDSMVGYKNETYLYFGRAAARLDDVLNLVPSRISALMMIAVSPLAGMDGKNALRIFKRDRFHHASPNSAQTEAAAAGALHIQLAGDAYYFGKLYPKKTIGDGDRHPEYQDIARVNKLLYWSSCFLLGCILVIYGLLLCL